VPLGDPQCLWGTPSASGLASPPQHKYKQAKCKHNRPHVLVAGGQCPFNHPTTTLKSLKRPQKNKQKILRRRPRRRGELLQPDKPTDAGRGGEASIRPGGTAIKTLFTGGKRRPGRSFPEVRRCCSLREIVGVLPKHEASE